MCVSAASVQHQCFLRHLQHAIVRRAAANETTRVDEGGVGDAAHCGELVVTQTAPRGRQAPAQMVPNHAHTQLQDLATSIT